MLIRNGFQSPDDFFVRLALPETPLSALLPPSHLIEHGDYEELHEMTKRQGPSSQRRDRKSTRLNSSHSQISYAVFCLKKKKNRYHDIGDLIVYRLRQYTSIQDTE